MKPSDCERSMGIGLEIVGVAKPSFRDFGERDLRRVSLTAVRICED